MRHRSPQDDDFALRLQESRLRYLRTSRIAATMLAETFLGIVAKDLKPIYTAVDADAALLALERFETAWGERYPMIGNTWRQTWEHVIPFLAFPTEVRRVVYTTNTIEALHRQIRKTIKTRGHVPTEDAARKLIYLSIINAQKSWRYTYHWSAALHSFKIHFGDRLP